MNLILHWLVALLVFRIVRDHLWLGRRGGLPVALAAALMVAVHPLNTEPVELRVGPLGAADRRLLPRGVRRRRAAIGACSASCWRRARCSPSRSRSACRCMVLVHWPVRPRAPPPGRGASCGAARDRGGRPASSIAGSCCRRGCVASARQPDVTPRIYFQTEWSALPLLPAPLPLAGRAGRRSARLSVGTLAARRAGLGQPARAHGARRRSPGGSHACGWRSASARSGSSSRWRRSRACSRSPRR